jgi:hypothetical protein
VKLKTPARKERTPTPASDAAAILRTAAILPAEFTGKIAWTATTGLV